MTHSHVALFVAMLAACAFGCACGSDPMGGPPDGGTPDAGSAEDVELPEGPVVSTYTGDAPPRDGFCAAGADGVMEIASLPATLRLDSRASLIDHARPSTRCTIAGAATGADFVFAFTPPDDGIFTVRTRAIEPGGWLDTVAYVRTGCDADGAELACNDDESIATYTSRLALEVEGGVRLFAVVDAFAEGDEGAFDVFLDFVPRPEPSPPGSDRCVDATELLFAGTEDTLIAVATGDTSSANNDSGCAGVPATNRLRDRFHAFTLTDTRDVAVRIIPDAFWDIAFYVRAACDVAETAACVDTRPPNSEESVVLPALPAGRYIIGVDAFDQPDHPEWESGPYHLEVTATRP